MKPASEVAEEIYAEAEFFQMDCLGKKQFVGVVTQALTEFAEERVKEAYETTGERCGAHVAQARAEGKEECDERINKVLGKKWNHMEKHWRAEALEEAAKVAESLSEPWQGGEVSPLEQGMGRMIAKHIRARKGKACHADSHGIHHADPCDCKSGPMEPEGKP